MKNLMFILVGALAQLTTGSVVPNERLTIPGLPGMEIDLSAINFGNIGEMLSGFGLFNLGTEVQKMIFTLTNDKNNYLEQKLIPERPDSFLNSTWDKTQSTKIVIHGYAEDGTGGPLSPTKKVITAYQNSKRPENLIFVDWRFLSRQLDYFTSAANTEKAGMRVAELLIFLRSANFISNLSDVHIIGFSLGAHVAGVAAYYATAITGERIGRISALDAAGPGFYRAEVKSILDPSDAIRVDAIHTNMGHIVTQFGTERITGHVDFYPNGGENQPGCTLPIVGEIVGVCSHIKAADYFANSINGAVYIGCPCKDWSTFKKGSCACNDGPRMGEFVDPNVTGQYYLTIPLGQ